MITILFIVIGCNANKQIQLTQLEDKKVEIFFIDYGDTQQCSIYLRKKVKVKNPYFWFAKLKIYYFVDGEQIDDKYACPMDYEEDGNLYFVGSDKGEVWGEVKIRPLDEREMIFQIFHFFEPFEFKGIYKSLEQYIPLAKHPLNENGETGEKNEDAMTLVYRESFSEFKRKNPALVDSLTKNNTFELEVLSPIKAKYRYDAQW